MIRALVGVAFFLAVGVYYKTHMTTAYFVDRHVTTAELLAGGAGRLPWQTMLLESPASTVVIGTGQADAATTNLTDYDRNLRLLVFQAKEAGKAVQLQPNGPPNFDRAMRDVAESMHVQIVQ
jgi:hypothetical protein